MIFRKLLIIRVALLLLLTMATAISYAAEGDIFTLLDDSSLRQGPNSSYSSAGVVRQGEQVVELDMKGGWVRIRSVTGGNVGWLYADSLERKNVNITQAKVTEVDVPDQTVTLQKTDGSVSDTFRNIVNALPATVKNVRGGMKKVMKTAIIRTEPGLSNDVLGWLAKGAHVQEVGRQGDWVKVRIPDGGSTGWVESSTIKSLNAVGATQTSSIPTPMLSSLKSVSETDPTAVSGKMLSDTGAVQFVKKANLRSGPAKRYEVVTWAGKDSYAWKLDRKGDWIQVKMRESGRVGWAYKNLLQQVSKGEKNPVATVVADHAGAVSDTPTVPTVTPLTSDSQAAMVMVDPLVPEQRRPIGENTTKQPSVSPIQTVVMQAKAVVKQSPVGMVESAVHNTDKQGLFTFRSKANLRAGHGVKYDVVSWAGKGSYASELARKGDWVRVQMQVSKRIGWVYKRSLKKVKLVEKTIPSAAVKARSALMQAPRVVSEHPVILSKESENTGYVERYQALRTEPLRLNPIRFAELTGWISKGELVVLMEKRGAWVRVKLLKAGKETGWVKSDYLEKVDVSTSIPTVKKKY